MTADELEALVRRGKPEEVPAAFAEMSEAERVALAPAAARLEKQCAREENAASRAYYAAQQPQLVPGSTVGVYAKAPPGVREALEAAGAQQRAACLALVGTASGTELMRRSWMLRGEEPFEILARRRPPWLWEWADKAVTKDWGHWAL